MADERIVIATTLTTFAMGGDERVWYNWLANAHHFCTFGGSVEFFCAIEVDARGIEMFQPLIDELNALGGTYFVYSLDDGRESITTINRQRHLTMGENICSDYASEVGATHMLFVAADCRPPADVLPKLLAVNQPFVGAECPTYCLSGEPVENWPFPVEAQEVVSAACMLLDRSVFTRLRWRYDGDLTDDPAYCKDARELLNVLTLVRKDCIASHFPEHVPAIEARGYDMKVVRS